jgi:nitronate monooxygenase
MTHQTDNRALLRVLGIEKPIIQAPMAGVSTPALAAAVSNAGGLGSLGVGAMNAAGARKVIEQTRALTSKPFNINVFTHSPATADPDVERQWLNWLAPTFEQYGATPPASLSEIYTSFAVDTAMLEVFLEEKPAVVSFHFGLPTSSPNSKTRESSCSLRRPICRKRRRLRQRVSMQSSRKVSRPVDIGAFSIPMRRTTGSARLP